MQPAAKFEIFLLQPAAAATSAAAATQKTGSAVIGAAPLSLPKRKELRSTYFLLTYFACSCSAVLTSTVEESDNLFM